MDFFHRRQSGHADAFKRFVPPIEPIIQIQSFEDFLVNRGPVSVAFRQIIIAIFKEGVAILRGFADDSLKKRDVGIPRTQLVILIRTVLESDVWAEKIGHNAGIIISAQGQQIVLLPIDEPELEDVLYPHFPQEVGGFNMLKRTPLQEEGICISDMFPRRWLLTQSVDSLLTKGKG